MRLKMTTSFAALALVTVGCGGSDDTEGSEPAGNGGQAGTTAAPSGGDDNGAGAPQTTRGDAGGGGDGRSSAVITVGDETFAFEWEAGLIQQCDTDFFGGFWALAASTSDMPSFEAELWPDGAPSDRASKIEVDSGDSHWTADPEETLGQTVENWPAQVESFEVSGSTASGTATFVGQFDFGEEPEGIPGTFEITCAS